MHHYFQVSHRVCVRVCVRACVCVCVGALVVQLVESWVYDPEDTGGHWFESQGRREKRTTKNITSTPAHPSVKRVPGLVLGEQSTPTVTHCTTNGSGGTTGCPPLMVVVGGMVGTSCEFLARAPGVLIAPAHRTCLVHRCPGLSRNA